MRVSVFLAQCASRTGDWTLGLASALCQRLYYSYTPSLVTHLPVSLHAARDISFSMRISWPYCLCPFPNPCVHSCQCDGVKRLGQQDGIKLWRRSPSEWAERLCPGGFIQQQGAVVPVESSPQQTPVPEPWPWNPMSLELWRNEFFFDTSACLKHFGTAAQRD